MMLAMYETTRGRVTVAVDMRAIRLCERLDVQCQVSIIIGNVLLQMGNDFAVEPFVFSIILPMVCFRRCNIIA